MFVVLVLVLVAIWLLVLRDAPTDSTLRYDCVIVPGGGLDAASREPAAWVAARLDAALMHDANTDYYLVLSRGTTHKPPPLAAGRYPVDESFASARYLVARGVAPSRILLESWSLDTIGNAAFARLMHADLRAWRRMLVVTSKFHRPRTEAIFEWVFGLPDASGRARRPTAQLSYEEAEERGMDASQSASRSEKEARGLESLRRTTALITSLEQLHAFLFVRHDAYRALTAEEHAARERERDEREARGAHAEGGAIATY